MTRKKPRSLGRMLYLGFVVAIYIFLLTPMVIVVLAAVNGGEYLTFPPQGFSLRWFDKFFHSPPFVRAFLFSLRLGIMATAISTVIGTAAALYVVRFSQRYRDILRMVIISPLLFPAILTGIALLLYYYASGMGARTFTGLLIGHVLITLPYVFLTVSTSLYNFDRSLEEVSRSLGARPFTTFRTVTLPLIKGGVISGAVFAFISSFDQFAVSLLLAAAGQTPLPIQLFDYLRFAFDPTAAAVSTVSIVMAVAVVLITQKLVGLEALYWGSGG